MATAPPSVELRMGGVRKGGLDGFDPDIEKEEKSFMDHMSTVVHTVKSFNKVKYHGEKLLEEAHSNNHREEVQ